MGYSGWENFNPDEKAKDPRRQLQGYINRAVGNSFEKYLIDACEVYAEAGIAFVEKTPEPFKVTGKKRIGKRLVFEGHFEKKAQPDFKGTLKGGRSIVF